MRKLFIPFLLVLALLPLSCVQNPDAGPEANGFDRKEMLRFYASRQIIPAFQALNSEALSMKEMAVAFYARPDSAGLRGLQVGWERAFQAWQRASVFNFGPAGEEGLRKSLWEEAGVFPVSRTKIDNILETGTFNLNDFNRDARGFLAIEYLIFDQNYNQRAVLTRFENVYARQYLVKLCEHVSGLISPVLQSWEGSYQTSFTEDNSTATGSSTAMLYNGFVKSFEMLKNLKLGLPLGKRPGQTGVQPELAEAVYSDNSLKYINLHFEVLTGIWKGTGLADGESEQGFRAYLASSEGGPALISQTEFQIQKVREALNAVPADRSFSKLLNSADPSLEQLHTELQKLTRFFKSDMSSVLGISISYASGDGD